MIKSLTLWYDDNLKKMKSSFLELKRAKKSLSKVSEVQKFWIDKLNEVENVEACVCYGCEQAINLIKGKENE